MKKIAANTVNSKLVNFAIDNCFKDQHSDAFYENLFTLIYLTPIEEVSSYKKVIDSKILKRSYVYFLKIAKWIYMFLEILSRNYPSFFVRFPVQAFSKILEVVQSSN